MSSESPTPHTPKSSDLDRAKAIMTTLCAETAWAISLYAEWEHCARNQPLIEFVKKKGIYESFGVIERALHMTLIATLMRLHDKRRHVASLPRLAHLLGQSHIKKALKQEFETTGSAKSEGQIQDALNELRVVAASPELAALRSFRNWTLAHKAEIPSPSGAMYGFERRLLEATQKIVHELNWAICGSHSMLARHRRACEGKAKRFWRTLTPS